jgi:mycothiol synthase
MNASPYTVRNYLPSDYKSYVKFKTAAAKPLPGGERRAPEAIREIRPRPGYCPEQDLLVVIASGKIIGATEIVPELASGRVILNYSILPEHGGQGPEEPLFNRAIRRGKEMGAKTARVNVKQENTTARRVLPELGFRQVKRYLEMKLSLAEVKIPDASNGAYSVEHLQPGDEEKLTSLQNRSFADNWEYNPNTVQEIAEHLDQSRSLPEDVLLIYDTGKPAGYCWTKIEDGTGSKEGKTGRIHMLGVDRDYRHRGLGRIALFGGLSYLKSRGVDVVELTVDSDNSGALSLYRSTGFSEWASSLWYEKTID